MKVGVADEEGEAADEEEAVMTRAKLKNEEDVAVVVGDDDDAVVDDADIVVDSDAAVGMEGRSNQKMGKMEEPKNVWILFLGNEWRRDGLVRMKGEVIMLEREKKKEKGKKKKNMKEVM